MSTREQFEKWWDTQGYPMAADPIMKQISRQAWEAGWKASRAAALEKAENSFSFMPADTVYTAPQVAKCIRVLAKAEGD